MTGNWFDFLESWHCFVDLYKYIITSGWDVPQRVKNNTQRLTQIRPAPTNYVFKPNIVDSHDDDDKHDNPIIVGAGHKAGQSWLWVKRPDLRPAAHPPKEKNQTNQ